MKYFLLRLKDTTSNNKNKNEEYLIRNCSKVEGELICFGFLDHKVINYWMICVLLIIINLTTDKKEEEEEKKQNTKAPPHIFFLLG